MAKEFERRTDCRLPAKRDIRHIPAQRDSSALHRKTIITKETTPSSPEITDDLLHDILIGNGLFPQTYLAQGILLAEKISTAAHGEQLPLDSFFALAPSSQTIADALDHAKVILHKQYGFHTSSQDNQIYTGIWTASMDAATYVTTNMARVVCHAYYGKSPQPKEVRAAVQNFPELDTMLHAAHKGLRSKQVQALSHQYKGNIQRFMEEYAQDPDFSWRDDPHTMAAYSRAKAALQTTLNQLLAETGTLIYDTIVDTVTETYPDNMKLCDSLLKGDPYLILGKLIQSIEIDPLGRYQEKNA